MTPKTTQKSSKLLSWFQKGGPWPCFQQTDSLYPKLWGQSRLESWWPNPCPAKLWGPRQHPVYPKGGTSTPLGLWGGTLSKRRLFLSINILWTFFIVWTYLGSNTPSFLFLLSILIYLSYACFTTVFWKPITYMVSQVHSWRIICLTMNHTLNSTHILFRWYLDATLDFRF